MTLNALVSMPKKESDEDEMVRQTALSYLIEADYQPTVLQPQMFSKPIKKT